jgi:hypothetical protein
MDSFTFRHLYGGDTVRITAILCTGLRTLQAPCRRCSQDPFVALRIFILLYVIYCCSDRWFFIDELEHDFFLSFFLFPSFSYNLIPLICTITLFLSQFLDASSRLNSLLNHALVISLLRPFISFTPSFRIDWLLNFCWPSPSQ